MPMWQYQMDFEVTGGRSLASTANCSGVDNLALLLMTSAGSAVGRPSPTTPLAVGTRRIMEGVSNLFWPDVFIPFAVIDVERGVKSGRLWGFGDFWGNVFERGWSTGMGAVHRRRLCQILTSCED